MSGPAAASPLRPATARKGAGAPAPGVRPDLGFTAGAGRRKSCAMADDRLPTELWIRAHIRRCIVDGIPAYVGRRGADHSGTVLVKLNQLELGCRVLTQVRDLDGSLAWLGALGGGLVSEAEADAY